MDYLTIHGNIVMYISVHYHDITPQKKYIYVIKSDISVITYVCLYYQI